MDSRERERDRVTRSSREGGEVKFVREGEREGGREVRKREFIRGLAGLYDITKLKNSLTKLGFWVVKNGTTMFLATRVQNKIR